MLVVLHGTTACEKPLFRVIFVFEHFFYSSASYILNSSFSSVNSDYGYFSGLCINSQAGELKQTGLWPPIYVSPYRSIRTNQERETIERGGLAPMGHIPLLAASPCYR
jgi:hypothetical protein